MMKKCLFCECTDTHEFPLDDDHVSICKIHIEALAVRMLALDDPLLKNRIKYQLLKLQGVIERSAKHPSFYKLGDTVYIESGNGCGKLGIVKDVVRQVVPKMNVPIVDTETLDPLLEVETTDRMLYAKQLKNLKANLT